MEQKKVYEQPASETVIIAPEQGMLIQTSAGFNGDPEEVDLDEK